MSSSKEVQLEDLMPLIVEKLASGGTVTFTPNGTSMLPMLRDGEDVVVLSAPKGRLSLFDVPLYCRDNGQYVLHRVIDFGYDGTYVMCGDNQFKKERGIRDDQIIAVMTGFYRKGKMYQPYYLRYRLYVNFWYYTRTFRRAYRFGKRKTSRLFGGKKEKETESKTETKTETNTETKSNE